MQSAMTDLQTLLDCSVSDSEGVPHRLGDLVDARPKTLLVFVRHFG